MIYHQGSNPRVLAAFNVLPETQSEVLVLSNTLALVDTAEWVEQILLETFLNVREQPQNTYVKNTKDNVDNVLAWLEPLYKDSARGPHQ